MGSKYAANTEHLFLRLPDAVLGNYNCWDSYQTARLVAPLLDELRSRGNLRYALDVMEPLQTAVINMQGRGLLLDKDSLRSYRSQVLHDLDDADHLILQADTTGDLHKPTPKYPNGIGSPKRLGKFLFETLGLKPPKKTETGLDSTDQETLYRILRNLRKKDEPHRPILLALFHRSRLKTISQRYLKLEPDPDGRVRPQVKMYGTKTMRFAYADPALQQFPPEARHIFRAQDRCTLLQADYSQLEARLLAHLSGDTPSQGAFEAGVDVHRQNAADLFGCGLDGITKEGRNFAKTFLYGLSYGGSTETMKTKLFCPCPKCEASVPPTLSLKRAELKTAGERWFRIHRRVSEFQEETAKFVRQNHYYESPLGARRWIAKPWGAELDRELKNLPMQFGAALLMNQRQVQLDLLNCPIILQMHDSFLLEVPDDEVDDWASRVREVMEAPIEGLGGVQIPVDIETGRNWGTLTEWHPKNK
jgi:DNA polymerase-1